MEIMAIYKPGSANLQTTVNNGLCVYSGVHRESGKDFTVKKYLEYLNSFADPGFVCIPLEDALDQIAEVEEKTYIEPWKEITEKQYDYALNVLPPEKWETVDGVNIFRMSEYMIGNITAHYARINNRCFFAHRRTTENYYKIAKEIIFKVYNPTIGLSKT